MAKPGQKIRVPLPEKEALDLLLKVRPTGDMPRQGTHPTGKKAKNRAKQGFQP
jgi:hypothetical protein